MRIILDRIEGDYAIVELPSGQMIDCPRAMLPGNAKEGSILNIAALPLLASAVTYWVFPPGKTSVWSK